jgi:thymidine phosphorylase
VLFRSGRTAGNALEVQESVEVLAGGGPSDVRDLTVLLARAMLDAVGLDRHDPADLLDNGAAMDSWKAMVRAQGGDPDAPLPKARESHTVHAVRDGIVTRLDAYGVGVAAWRLGAGRARKEDPVQAGAGVRWHVLQGERVRPGQALATLYTDSPELFPAAMADLAGAITVGDPADLAEQLPLLVDRIGR